MARRSGSVDPLQIEEELRRLTEPLEDLDATGGIEEARRALLDFLRDNDIASGTAEINGLDNYAVRLEWAIEQAADNRFSDYELGVDLERVIAEADVLVARAGHRVEGTCLEALIRQRVAMDFFAGPGREYLEDRVGLLMSQPGLEHREGHPILRAGFPGTSHFEDAGTGLPLCADGDGEPSDYRRFIEPMMAASCVPCRRLHAEARNGSRALVHEDIRLQLERFSGELARPTALELVAELRRGGRSLDAEEFTNHRRKAVWGAFCAHLASESRSQKCEEPIDLLSPAGSRLLALWDPGASEVPHLPEGLRI